MIFIRCSAPRLGSADQKNSSIEIIRFSSFSLLCSFTDSIVLLALKAMLSDFVFFMALAIVIFSGFLYAFYSLSDRKDWSLGGIAWLMLKIWFVSYEKTMLRHDFLFRGLTGPFTFVLKGSSYAGFDAAEEFSKLLGPPLMVLFAVMR